MGETFFKLTADTLTPDLLRKMQQMGKLRTVYEAGAKAVEVQLKKHLRELQARGNAMGWPPRHFFAGGKESVIKNVGVTKVSDQGAIIAISDPRFLHRIYGGTIQMPKRKQYMTIPLNAEAYALGGKGSLKESAPGLVCVRLPEGGGFPAGLYLVKVKRLRGKRKGKQSKEWKALKKFGRRVGRQVGRELRKAGKRTGRDLRRLERRGRRSMRRWEKQSKRQMRRSRVFRRVERRIRRKAKQAAKQAANEETTQRPNP